MNVQLNKPVIGFSVGDINGVGTELIIKAFSDPRILELCTPVIFGSNKLFNFYRKTVPDVNFNFQVIKDLTRINHKQVNVFNVWEEDIEINPGQLTDTGGKYAILSLRAAVEALKAHQVHALVTAPIHKNNTHSEEFDFTGHTPYLKSAFNSPEVVMLMVASTFRVALLTEHIP